jgi:hypothetical protein
MPLRHAHWRRAHIAWRGSHRRIEEEDMSGLSRFSPTAPCRFLCSPLRKGLIIALLALGVVAGVRGPVAHADAKTCYIHQVEHNYVNLPNNWGRLDVYLWAKYSYYDGSYCGATWAEAKLHENPNVNAPWGKVYAILQNCNYTTQTSASVAVRGGGTVGQDYVQNTAAIYLTCGRATSDFIPVSGGTSYWAPTATHTM